MILAIFGATGNTGGCVLEQALANGYSARVLVRDPAKLKAFHPRLTVVQGNVLNPVKVTETIAGAEAVLCALGSGLISPDKTLSVGTCHIVRAMQDCGARRIVAVTVYGVGNSRAYIPFGYKLLLALLRRYCVEKAMQEQALMESGLDWTIVRPTQNTLGPKTGRYYADTGNPPSLHPVRHADVAELMLRIVTSEVFCGQAVTIAGAFRGQATAA